MAYIDINNIKNLNKNDIDSLSKFKIYKCHALIDNEETVEYKDILVFAHDNFEVPNIVDRLLCKESYIHIRTMKISEIEIGAGDACVITDEYKFDSCYVER